jgi:hypothetical protein
MEHNCLINPQRQKLQRLLVRELCDVLPMKVCVQWDAFCTIGPSHSETKISVLALDYHKTFQLACVFAVTNVINLPYYILNLKVNLGLTRARLGSWYLLSQMPKLILVQSVWECAEINIFLFYACPRYVFLHWLFAQYSTILVINTLVNETLKEKAQSFHSLMNDHLGTFYHV